MRESLSECEINIFGESFIHPDLSLNDRSTFGSLQDLVAAAAFTASRYQLLPDEDTANDSNLDRKYGVAIGGEETAHLVSRQEQLAYLKNLVSVYGSGRSDGRIDTVTWKNIHKSLGEGREVGGDGWIYYSPGGLLVRENVTTGVTEVRRSVDRNQFIQTINERDRRNPFKKIKNAGLRLVAFNDHPFFLPDWYSVSLYPRDPLCSQTIIFDEESLSQGSGATKQHLVRFDNYRYEVFLESADEKHQKGYQPEQTAEQWEIEAFGGPSVWKSLPTTDLEETETSVVDFVGFSDDLDLAQEILGSHAGEGTGPQSITPVSASFEASNCATRSDVLNILVETFEADLDEASDLLDTTGYQNLLRFAPRDEKFPIDAERLARLALLDLETTIPIQEMIDIDLESDRKRFTLSIDEDSLEFLYLLSLNTAFEPETGQPLKVLGSSAEIFWKGWKGFPDSFPKEEEEGGGQVEPTLRDYMAFVVPATFTAYDSDLWPVWVHEPALFDLGDENRFDIVNSFYLPSGNYTLERNLLDQRQLAVTPDGVFLKHESLSQMISFKDLLDGCPESESEAFEQASEDFSAAADREEIEEAAKEIPNKCWENAYKKYGLSTNPMPTFTKIEESTVLPDDEDALTNVVEVGYPNGTSEIVSPERAEEIKAYYLDNDIENVDDFQYPNADWANIDSEDLAELESLFEQRYPGQTWSGFLVDLKDASLTPRGIAELVGSVPGIDTFGDVVFCSYDAGTWIGKKISDQADNSITDAAVSCAALAIPGASAGAAKTLKRTKSAASASATTTVRSRASLKIAADARRRVATNFDSVKARLSRTGKASSSKKLANKYGLPTSQTDAIFDAASPEDLGRIDALFKGASDASERQRIAANMATNATVTKVLLGTGDPRVLDVAFKNTKFVDEIKTFDGAINDFKQQGFDAVVDVEDSIVTVAKQRVEINELEDWARKKNPGIFDDPPGDPPVTMEEYLSEVQKWGDNNMYSVRGDIGEIQNDLLMLENGYAPIHAERLDGFGQKIGQTGIDGLYYNPTKPPGNRYLVSDAKVKTQKASDASLTTTKKGKQLSDEWMEADDNLRIRRALGEPKNASNIESQQFKDLADDIVVEGYDRVIFSTSNRIGEPSLARYVKNDGNIDRGNKFP